MARARNISSENWKYNARGVDINRNFPCKSYVQQQLYEYPGSESETQMLMRIFRDYETVAYLDFHSRGKIIYYYRNAMPNTYNQKCRQFARALQHVSGYALGRREEELLAGAGRVLVRASGTEALIRVMVEAKTESEAEKSAVKLVNFIKSLKF